MRSFGLALMLAAIVAAGWSWADAVKENEASALRVCKTSFKDDFERKEKRAGDPKLVRSPISKGLLEETGKAVYTTKGKLDIPFTRKHYRTPKELNEYFAFGCRVDGVVAGKAEIVCKAALGEFAVALASRKDGGLDLTTLDFGVRPRRLEIPESALPADVMLFARKDGGFAVTVTSLADGSRRVVTGDAAFFRELFAVGFDLTLRLEAETKETEATWTIDNLLVGQAESTLKAVRPRPAVKPQSTFDPRAAGWERKFHDDFDGEKLDPAKWLVPTFYKHPEAAQVDGQGHLAITCDFVPGTSNLFSTSLWSVPSFKFGYFEAKVKFTKNNGWWSAFWLYPMSCANSMTDGAEIDIFEDYYTRSARPEDPHPAILDHNLHVFAGKTLKSWNYRSELPGTIDDWYRIGCKWTPFEISYYVNGKLMSSKANHSPYESVTFDALNHAAVAAPLHIVLSGCIMSGWGHRNTTGFKFPERYLVDSVEVWQEPAGFSPKVVWDGAQARAVVSNGEYVAFSAKANSDKTGGRIVKAWLFDNGYPIAEATKAPLKFEFDYTQAYYDATRYMSTGRQGVKPPWDGLAHFYRVYVQDDSGAIGSTADYRFRIPTGSEASRPWNGVRHAVPGSIEPWQFDEGERGVSHHSLVSKAKASGKLRKDTALKCERGVVAQLKSGEWLSYSVDVKTGGVYRVEFDYASGSDTENAVEYIVDGVSRGRFLCPRPGKWNWNKQSAQPLSEIHLEKGEHEVKLLVSGYLSVRRQNYVLIKAD